MAPQWNAAAVFSLRPGDPAQDGAQQWRGRAGLTSGPRSSGLPVSLSTAPGPAGSLAPTENRSAASFPSRPSMCLGCPDRESCQPTPALGQGQVGGPSSQETENTQGAKRLSGPSPETSPHVYITGTACSCLGKEMGRDEAKPTAESLKFSTPLVPRAILLWGVDWNLCVFWLWICQASSGRESRGEL